jgi:ribosomal subunit interface protein
MMSSHLVFNGVDDAVKTRVETYWAEKLPRLQKLLVPYSKDLQEIRLTVSHHPQNSHRSWYEVRAVIQLPTGTLAAEADDGDPQVAVDRVADKLVAELRRHKERVRHDYIDKRKARNRADLSAAGPLLERDVENGRRDDFFRLLRPHLRFLRDHARRELRFLELHGMLHRGEMTVTDLLDEVLIRAWQQFADRPRRLSLDLWLTDLLHETLAHWMKQEPRPHVSLEDKAENILPDEVPQEDEDEWWAELLGEDETFTLEDLIPDREGTPAWDQLDAKEQRDQLLSLFRGMPPARRQAFLLHALEDFTTHEIAILQDRPEGEVKADIEAARRTLRERLLAGGYLQKAGKPAAASATATETESRSKSEANLTLGSVKE